MRALGIDIGGSGFRMGVFDTASGALIGNFVKQEHTDSSNPTAVLDAIEQSVNALGWQGPVGIGFPGVVEENVVKTAPNLGEKWVGADFSSLAHVHGGAFSMLNDADCVAEGELHFGIGHRGHARVLTLTIGTGLGTTLHTNGTLIPNLEYGRLPHPTRPGLLEHHLSGRTRTEQNLSLSAWAAQFQEGLDMLEGRLQPDMIVLYGGIMEHWGDLQPLLNTRAELQAAMLATTAGPLGAAWSAVNRS